MFHLLEILLLFYFLGSSVDNTIFIFMVNLFENRIELVYKKFVSILYTLFREEECFFPRSVM